MNMQLQLKKAQRVRRKIQLNIHTSSSDNLMSPHYHTQPFLFFFIQLTILFFLLDTV